MCSNTFVFKFNISHHIFKYFLHMHIHIYKSHIHVPHNLFFFNWRPITLQYCGGFCHTLTWVSHGWTCVPHPEPPPTSLAIPSLRVIPMHSALFHALNLDWWSISHMVIYMFQCYSLKSSHPCLLPQSPKVCSLYLCLFCCLTYRVTVTIFLNSIYMR